MEARSPNPPPCEKQSVQDRFVAWLHRKGALGWYLAVLMTLNTILLVFHPFGT